MPRHTGAVGDLSIWRYRFLFIYLVFVTGLLYAAFQHWAYDDPFITYRYAENLARGRGLVYNPGERVLSTTTPLFAALLALLSFLWADFPHLANLIGAFSIALGALFLWDLARSWKTEMAGWAALVLYPTFTLLLSTFGSETPLYLAFCLGAFAFYGRRNYPLAAVFAGLALLTRGDGALVVGVLGLDYLLRVRWPLPWRAILLFLLITLPWFGFAWMYYGSPMPVTLAVKQNQGAMVISQKFAEGFITVARDHLALWEYRIEAGLAGVGLLWVVFRKRHWLSFLAWTVLYYLAYTFLGVSRYFWYYAPLVPGFVAAVGLGIAALSAFARDVIARLWQGSQGRQAVVPWVVTLILLFPLALAQFQNMLELRGFADRRYRIYREVGEWVSRTASPSAVIGTLEVGIIGYYAGHGSAARPFVDFAGLLQPEVAAQLIPEATYEDAAVWAVEQYHPDLLVLHAHLFPRLESGYVARQCQPVKTYLGDAYNYSSDLVIYSCSSP